jgi:PAS domain S-box-containing protein
MSTDAEKREFKRFDYMMPVEVTAEKSKDRLRAQMVNYGGGGMCFKSHIEFQPKETVSVHVNNNQAEMPIPVPIEDVNTVVKFCRKAAGEDQGEYFVGVQFLQPARVFRGLKRAEKSDTLRQQAEKFLDKRSQAIQEVPPEDIHRLVHELHVHQTELEMQNDELRRAQLEIETSRNRYSFLYDFAPIGYFTFNQYGQILEANLTGAKLLGVERKYFIDRAFSLYLSRTDQDAFRNHRLQVLRTREPQTCEIRLNKRNGMLVYLRPDSIAVQDADGRFSRHLTAVTDISRRKQAENEKEKLEYQLQQAQKMKAIGTLAGGIAHNFNNLLMGIEGRISLMLFDLNAGHPHYEQLQAIEKIIQSATQLTRELLGFARGGKYEIQPTDLNRLLKSTVEAFAVTRKDIEFRTTLQQDIRPVDADPSQIEQVLLNLYVNAMQAMPAGGILALRTENFELDEPAARELDLPSGRYVRVSVTDTGVGMDEATRQRVFDLLRPKRWRKAPDWVWLLSTASLAITMDLLPYRAKKMRVRPFSSISRLQSGKWLPPQRNHPAPLSRVMKRCCWWMTKTSSWMSAGRCCASWDTKP